VSNVTSPKTFRYASVLSIGLLVLAGLSARADDKNDAKDRPSGVWALQGGEMKLEFADKDVLKISPHGKDELILVLCKYTLGKDGTVEATITELEGKAKAKAAELLPVGLKFTFKWMAKDDKATLDDVKGDKVEALKSHLEGKYDRK
jgi:hypothetical protein